MFVAGDFLVGQFRVSDADRLLGASTGISALAFLERLEVFQTARINVFFTDLNDLLTLPA